MAPSSDQQAPPKLVLAAAMLVMVVAGGWFMLHFDTSYASRECSAQYRLAKTAADRCWGSLAVGGNLTKNSYPSPR